MSHQCEHEHDHHHDSPPPATNVAQSLFPFVNTPNVQCLNTNNHGSSDSAACFIKSRDNRYDVSKYLESDADCQMIIHVPFTCVCRVFSLVLRTSRSSSGTTSPKAIKIFKNFSKNIDFDTLEDSKPQHEVEHPRDVGIDLGGAPQAEITDADDSSFVEHHLPRHLFQNTHSLTIFMQSAWEDEEDITRCFYLEMRGESTGQKQGNNAVPLLTVYESAPNPVDHQKLENEKQSSNLAQPSSSSEADMIKERKLSKSRAPTKGRKQMPGVVKESQTVARTRTGNVEFTPAKTHDMVRSLFDPTLKKSFLECWISLAILSNVVLCYFMATRFGASFTKKFFLWQYVFWRLCYNVGIGVVLHFQSNYETLTNFAKTHSLFSKKSQHWLARFCRFEIESKMPNTYRVEEYPEEFNVWLLFRQFVDLILMQDFTTYILFVVLSIPKTVLSSHTVSFALGVIMILFNVWVKVDAHRVVKDYAWYWGDFFFFQDSKLVFDGVFNVSPHPMYSIGYMGYYGLSLISGDYKVLLVSIGGHLLQFLFLKYCENPHIEKIYGSDAVENDNAHIDELLVKENPNYSKPLITKGLWFTNLDKLRLTDYFTILTVFVIVSFSFFMKPSSKALFWAAFTAKITTSLFISLVLHKQSTSKWFTRLFLKNGYTQIHSFYQWQFLYNYCLTVSYTIFMLQTWSQFRNLESKNYTQIIFGILLCWLQKWCDDEILTAISEFGWFYGDFFLTNYISSRKLNSRGIYRYLSNPERFLGVAGCWGAVLITDFSPYNLILAALWTAANIALVKLVEEPHVAKVYGASDRKSGISKTLMGFKPIRRFSEIMDKMELRLVRHLTSNDSPFEEETSNNDDAQWNEVVQLALQSVTANLAPNCEFKLGDGKRDTFMIPGPIEVHWKLPSKLYNDDDWIGLYKVFDTGEDRHRTRVSSNGRWTGTNEAAFPYSGRPKNSIVEFQRTGSFLSGTVQFDHSLTFYEEGVYELRYHSGNTHKVLMISQPFRLSLPTIKAESAEELSESLRQFLAEVHALDGNSFNPNSNKYLGDKFLKGLVKKASGVDLSVKYLRRINYDVGIIGKRVQEIKSVLENLE